MTKQHIPIFCLRFDVWVGLCWIRSLYMVHSTWSHYVNCSIQVQPSGPDKMLLAVDVSANHGYVKTA